MFIDNFETFKMHAPMFIIRANVSINSYLEMLLVKT